MAVPPGLSLSSPDQIGPLLNGLRRMSAGNLNVRRLVTHVSEGLRDVSRRQAEVERVKNRGSTVGDMGGSSISEQAVRMSLYGMQSMSAESREVQILLELLAKEVFAMPGVLSGRTLANALYGK